MHELIPNIVDRVNNTITLNLGFILMNIDKGNSITLRVKYKRNEDYIIIGETASIVLSAVASFPQTPLSSAADLIKASKYVHTFNWALAPPANFHTVF